MILAIDIGNTTVTLGGVQTAAQMYSLEFTARIDINYEWSAGQYETSIRLLVTSESDLGMTFSIPHPEKVGRDRLVDAAWAAAHYPLPVITVDLGTATTFNVIRENSVFCGGAIAPGLDMGLNALAERTAQLPRLALQTPERIIGRNTEECILSGTIAGMAAMLDGMVQRIEAELGSPATLILTGGAARFIEPLVLHPHIYDPDLLLKGLAFLCERNCAN